MSRVELFTPWREAPESVRARTVGREALLSRLGQSAQAFAAHKVPLPLYLFGPRGIGKSHVIARMRPDFERLGLRVVVIPEDIPAIESAEDLLARANDDPELPAWMRPSSPRVVLPLRRPTVLIVEGLDRRLMELGSGATGHEQRQALRYAWDQSSKLWVLGTGVELPTALTDRDEPFFGWFDAEHVSALDDEQSAALLDHLVSESVRSLPHWAGRRSALVPLAGGSPRVLVTLAESCAAPEDADEASEALLSAIDRFTANFQMRFRDLSGVSQRIVEKLAHSPREMGPSEIARALDAPAQGVGTQCRRLTDDGVLGRREEGGFTWYRIAEPLFRYWLEYRSGLWDSTRVAVAASLLQALSSRGEAFERWRSVRERNSASRNVRKRKVRRPVQRVIDGLNSAVERGDALAFEQAALNVKEVDGLALLVQLPYLQFMADNPEVCQRCESVLAGIPGVSPTLHILRVPREEQSLRRAFEVWLRAVTQRRPHAASWAPLVTLLLTALDDAGGLGQPWQLSPAEIRIVSTIPVLRAQFLLRGRARTHDALVRPGDLQGVRLELHDPDLGLLIHAAMVRGAPELAVAALQAVMSGGGPVESLPMNPDPGAAFPRERTQFVSWMVNEAAENVEAVLSWARTLVDVPEELFRAVCASLRMKGESARGGGASARSGLLALGLADSVRLDELVESLPRAWQRDGLYARALADQLSEPHAGRLHPELAHLYGLLSGRSP